MTVAENDVDSDKIVCKWNVCLQMMFSALFPFLPLITYMSLNSFMIHTLH